METTNQLEMEDVIYLSAVREKIESQTIMNLKEI
jgi:predicted RNA-binding protein